ncbi:hypothetical protein PHGAL3_0008 [Phage Altai3]|nr:hypothetical protein PHGAL3_0008 [Phage Altai3]
MNLDRFAYGLDDPQDAPVVGECMQCKGEIYKDNEVIRYEGDLFCDTVCLSEFLLEIADYEEVVAGE